MSLLVPINGANYIIPETNEVGWGSNLDDFFVAISAGVLQKTGGSFTLSAETDFGASFGLKSLYYKSRSSNVSSTGAFRLANAEAGIGWRNFLNNGDLLLTVNASNQLTFNGVPIESNSLTSSHILVGNGSNIATDVAMSGDLAIDNTGATTIQAGVVTSAKIAATTIVNSNISASAAIAYSKLALTGSIVNADINASAAIAYAKLALTGSILNADLAGSIAYSKLVLTNSVVNADINSAAAIAYSKLNLATSIVNADINASAAIAITKIATGTANQVLGTNNAASANEFKTLMATANQVSVTHGAGTVTFATPQDIGTASAVQHGSLALGGSLNASSILSLTSTSKGFLPPIMTTTQKNAISTPTDGLIVYDSTLAQLFLRASSTWTPLSVGGGSGTVATGTQYQLGYYAAGGTTLSGLTLITGSRALASDANGLPVASATTAAELAFVNGVTSAIQTQLNLKAPLASPTFTGTLTAPNLAITDGTNQLVLGSTRTVTITAPIPATSSRTWTIPDITGNGTFAALEGTQTFSGAKTFSAAPTISVNTANATLATLQNSATSCAAYIGITGATNTNGLYISSNRQIGGTILNTASTTAAIYLETSATTSTFIVQTTPTVNAAPTTRLQIDLNGVADFSGQLTGKGTATNDSPTAGYIGEVIQAVNSAGSAMTTSGNYADITSIALTAGDWLVSGVSEGAANSTTFTGFAIGISATSGNSLTGLVEGSNLFFITATSATGWAVFGAVSMALPSFHVQLASPATYYLKYKGTYTGTAPTVYGRITAVRIR